MMTLFLAGHETTAIALSWACYLLAQNPQIEAKLVEELRSVLGYRVPAGSNVFILQWITQRDPRFFPDPERFNPERWREDPVRSGKIPRFAYLPFGGGPRVCVGASFAMMEAILLLAMIQQRYHLELVPDHPVEVFASVTLRPKHGIRVIVKHRELAE